MKTILKSIIIFILITLIMSVILWISVDYIPLYKEIIKTMEITTGNHLTFVDYLKTVFFIELIGILTTLIKSVSKLFLDN